MGLKFKVGDAVQQAVKPIKGFVSELVLTDDNSVVQFIVDYTDENGDLHRRPFTEEQLEAQAKAASETPDVPAA